MTYLQILNKVLVKLREDQVAAINSTEYSTMLGDFINQVKSEIEDAWNWSALRTTVQLTTVSGTSRYTLTGAGSNFRVLDVIHVTNEYEMKPVSSKWLDLVFTSNSDSGDPVYYGFNGTDSNGDPYVDVWPVPSASGDLINFNMIVKQDDLSATTDVPLIPAMPLILGTYALAVSERGEDVGIGYNEADEKYRRSLGDAIAFDMALFTDEVTAEVV